MYTQDVVFVCKKNYVRTEVGDLRKQKWFKIERKFKIKIGYILYVDRFYVDHKFDIYI